MRRLLLALMLCSSPVLAANVFVNLTDADQQRWADVDALMLSCGPVTKVQDCPAVVNLLRDFSAKIKAAPALPPPPIVRTPAG